MADTSWASSPGVRASMRSNRGRDTGPELALRRAVHALGLRYKVNARPLPGVRRTADLVFTRARVAVFLDGCFWHGCPHHHTVAATNAGFWAEKVATNRRRDADTDRTLSDAGWLPLRIWEHEPVPEAADRVRDAVNLRRAPEAASPDTARKLSAAVDADGSMDHPRRADLGGVGELPGTPTTDLWIADDPHR